jgi:outer membrane protein assembly factor BamB
MLIFKKRYYNNYNYLTESVNVLPPLIEQLKGEGGLWSVAGNNIVVCGYTKDKQIKHFIKVFNSKNILIKEIPVTHRFQSCQNTELLTLWNEPDKTLIFYDEEGDNLIELMMETPPFYIDSHNIFTVTEDGFYCKYDNNGNWIWKSEKSKKAIFGFKEAWNDTYFYFTQVNMLEGHGHLENKGFVICISQFDGKLIWQKEIDQIKHHVPILLFNNLLLVENTTNGILCLEASSGKMLWNWRTSEEVRINRQETFRGKIYSFNLDSITDIRTYTLDYEGILHILDFDQYIQINVESGTVLREFELNKAIKKLKLELKKTVSPATYLGPTDRPIVTATHFIVSILNYVVFINKRTGIIEYTYQLEEKEGRVQEFSIIGENRAILVESGYNRKNRGGSYSIWKVLESNI